MDIAEFCRIAKEDEMTVTVFPHVRAEHVGSSYEPGPPEMCNVIAIMYTDGEDRVEAYLIRTDRGEYVMRSL